MVIRIKGKVITCAECGQEKPHEAHGLCKKCYSNQYRRDNPDYHKQWYQDNKEKKKEYDRQWYQDNKETKKEYLKQWRRDNPDYHKHYHKQWRRDNPEKERARHQRRRARKAGNGGSYTAKEWKKLCKQYPDCPCCGEKFTRKNKPTVDHVIPLTKGGTNDIGNIQPLCKSCNSRKGTKSTDYRR